MEGPLDRSRRTGAAPRIHWRAVAVPPRGEGRRPERSSDPGALAAVAEDASRMPGGSATSLYRPRSEAEIVAIVRDASVRGEPLLPLGAQTSLTGGATPFGAACVSLAEMQTLHSIDASPRTAVCEPGVRLAAIQEAAARQGLFYPPAPTYDLATIGGSVSTNAAGSASYKYGVTRDWIRRIRVVLATGDVFDLARGEVLASPEGRFELQTEERRAIEFEIPRYAMPPIKKQSAGYFAAAGMDLVDLFIGSEGTLGIVTEIEVALAPRPAGLAAGLAFVRDDASAMAFAEDLAQATASYRSGRDGIDVRAIEYLDENSLALLRERGQTFPRLPLPSARAAVWFEAEVDDPRETDRLLGTLAPWDDVLVALPTDPDRARVFRDLREAVPLAVVEKLQELQRDADPLISKVGGDASVPFERLAGYLASIRAEFNERAIPIAIWGHLSDGNLHPNALPRSRREMESARDALLTLGELAIACGGSPMAEHGVGRNPLKQELLRRFRGELGVRQMRAVKRALDPQGLLSPGVLFPAEQA